MSQRKEKYARQTAEIKERVSSLENRMFFLELQANRSAEEHKRARHAATAAQCEAARWEINAVLALVLLGLVAACCIVYASAQEPEAQQDGPVVQAIPDDGRLPGDDIPATERCYMTPEEIEAAENEMIEAALLANATRLDNVTVTHYDCCLSCCGKTDGITASGVRATPGVTVAVDPDVIPLGADVLVDYGDGEINYYRADDVGGSIRGNRIDLCVSSHQEALDLGRRTATVWWVILE